MIAIGINAAIRLVAELIFKHSIQYIASRNITESELIDSCSVRVSNELGAAHPRTARFSLVVATLASLLIGLVIALALVLARNHYPDLFTNDDRVKELVKELTPLLAACVIINNIQPALSGTVNCTRVLYLARLSLTKHFLMNGSYGR